MATSLLNNVYSEIKNEVSNRLKSTNYLHLQCDGWSNVNNEGILNFVISNPEPYFVKSVSTEGNRHTILYLSNELLKIIRNYGESKFFVLIGDNARNVQKAFEIVKNTYRHITPMNCVAHTLKLLAHDIIKCDTIIEFIELAIEIIKTIKKVKF